MLGCRGNFSNKNISLKFHFDKWIFTHENFRYNDKYFSFSVYIYGFVGDTTPLKGTIINYWFKDYTKHVNEYIQCINRAFQTAIYCEED